ADRSHPSRTSTRRAGSIEKRGSALERYQDRLPPLRPRRREHLRSSLPRITVAVHEHAERPRLEIIGRKRHTTRHVHYLPEMAHAFRSCDALRRPKTIAAGESR